MLPLLSLFARWRMAWLPSAALGAALVSPGPAQAGLAITPAPTDTFVFRIPVRFLAPANASGEAVQFQGEGRITTRLVRDPDSGTDVLLATFDTNGIVGTGAPSLSRYVLTTKESIVLPHAATQSVSLTFPMEPQAGSPLARLRTGVANLGFSVDVTSGAITRVTSASIALL